MEISFSIKYYLEITINKPRVTTGVILIELDENNIVNIKSYSF